MYFEMLSTVKIRDVYFYRKLKLFRGYIENFKTFPKIHVIHETFYWYFYIQKSTQKIYMEKKTMKKYIICNILFNLQKRMKTSTH